MSGKLSSKHILIGLESTGDYGLLYDSLLEKIGKEVHRVPNNDIVGSVENWSHRILLILKTKGTQLK